MNVFRLLFILVVCTVLIFGCTEVKTEIDPWRKVGSTSSKADSVKKVVKK